MDTDVNACALYEYKFGNHRTIDSLAYITVGTGVGLGLVINGKTVHGLIHPEGGHCRLQILDEDKEFKGVCPSHGNCLEGMVNNHSICQYMT